MADTAVVVSTQLNVQGFYTDPWFSVHLLVSLAQVSAGKQRDRPPVFNCILSKEDTSCCLVVAQRASGLTISLPLSTPGFIDRYDTCSERHVKPVLTRTMNKTNI